MPRPAFFRVMSPAVRAEFDAEIRRRGYADLEGLVGWLANRGVRVGKSSVCGYANRLRRADESSVNIEFSAESQAAILEYAALVIQLRNAWCRIESALELQGIRN